MSTRENQIATAIPESLADWMWADGETGNSSMQMAMTYLGREWKPDWASTHYPHDPADFRRCLLLIEREPMVESSLSILANKFSGWRNVVEIWDELEASLKKEIGDDLPTLGWSAPATYRKMEQAQGRL